MKNIKNSFEDLQTARPFLPFSFQEVGFSYQASFLTVSIILLGLFLPSILSLIFYMQIHSWAVDLFPSNLLDEFFTHKIHPHGLGGKVTWGYKDSFSGFTE